MSRVHARVVPLLAALAMGAALPAGALAQTPAPQLPGLSEEPPPWEGEEDPDGSEPGEPGGNGGSNGGEPSGNGEGGGSDPSGGEGEPSGADGDPGSTGGADRPAAGELPSTGSEPLLLAFSGAALALLGTGLRLRTLDADVF